MRVCMVASMRALVNEVVFLFEAKIKKKTQTFIELRP